MTFSILAVGASLGEVQINLSERFVGSERTLKKTRTEIVHSALEPSAKYGAESLLDGLKESGVRPHDVDALICVTQSPDRILPGLTFDIMCASGLRSDVLRFDINDGCSGFVQALFLAEHLPKSAATVVIVCVDRYRSKLDPDDHATGALFSDGATATVIKRPGSHRVSAFRSRTEVKGIEMLHQGLGFADALLHMDGYGIYKTVRAIVVPEVNALLTSVGSTLRFAEQYFFHQASGIVLDMLKEELRLVGDTPSNLATRGNLVSSSIPMLIKDTPSWSMHAQTVLVGFGVGFHVASMILERAEP